MMMMNNGVRVHDVGLAQFNGEIQCEAIVNGGKIALVSLEGLGNETSRVSLGQIIIIFEAMSAVFIQMEVRRIYEGKVVIKQLGLNQFPPLDGDPILWLIKGGNSLMNQLNCVSLVKKKIE